MAPIVIGHRGASAVFPENTVEAFRGARDLGADWVELDVWGGPDGSLVVTHDAPGGGSFPSLEEALAACEGMGVNVEIKRAPVGAVVDVIREWGGPALVSSFHWPTVDAVRVAAPEVPTALLVSVMDDPLAAVELAVARGHTALHPFVARADRDLIERCHAAGLAVNVWTVDDPGRMAELIADGVDGIVTNVVDVARAVVDRASAREDEP